MIVKVKPKDVVLEAVQLKRMDSEAIEKWGNKAIDLSAGCRFDSDESTFIFFYKKSKRVMHYSWFVRYEGKIEIFSDEEFKQKFDIIEEGGEDE